MDARPLVHALVCFMGPKGEFLTLPRLVLEEEAQNQAQWGAAVLIDPDEAAMVDLWEAYQADLEGGRSRKAWFESE